jgi:RimJ/RimL family protein N-acetyltransferase
LTLVFNRIPEIVSYLEARMDTVLHPPYTVIGIERNGEIKGGWLFNEYNGHHVEISAALDIPLTRGMIRAVKHYLFEQMRVRVVTGRCREANERSASLMTRLGFHFEGRIPLYYGDEAARFYSYTKGM